MATSEHKSAPPDELEALREENARLKALLARHGIAYPESLAPVPSAQAAPASPAAPQLSTAQKVALFRRLFRGRSDVYALRWASTKGKSGYAPACANEWRPGVCHKPKIKCADCAHRQLLPLTDSVIFDHLAGKCTVGVFPLLTDGGCHFLAVDFDGADWREDARGFLGACTELEIPAALEISRSGDGAHVWIFFDEAVPARAARQLGAALISHTCTRTRQLALSSYDRLFPNQDTMPKGGFGNLIALPLQKQPREQGCSVFVDETLTPYPDQWDYLASIRPLPVAQLEAALLRASGGRHPLDVAFAAEEDAAEPWRRPALSPGRLPGPLPASLTLVLANLIFIAKKDLPQPLANRLIRLAAFQNPEFYKAQALRLSVWNKPRIIGCAENFPHHIALPRGCLGAVLDLLEQNGIAAELRDERVSGRKVPVSFTGVLRKDQKRALRTLAKDATGVLCAPTAFGKTVTAAALIARRKVSTLILVHRTELLRQWQERLPSFLDLPKDTLGVIGGGKNRPTGQIDIAVMQSLSRREDLVERLDGYGQVIVDECHHLSAFSFEALLRQVKAKYVHGLTATPVRRDGHHPIIFMQCGPIRHTAAQPEAAPVHLEVWPRYRPSPELPPEAGIQEVFRNLAADGERNRAIVEDVLAAYQEGRKVLLLTERTDHLESLKNALEDQIDRCFVLHGRLSKKQRAAVFDALGAMEEATPHVLLATGRLVGEGFDHPPLDTLALAMPISWKGTLQQYAGRLHRSHADKQDVRIFDYVDTGQPQLARMWEKRQRGYRAMGYQILPVAEAGEDT